MQTLDMNNYNRFKSVHQGENYAATDILYKLYFRLNSIRSNSIRRSKMMKWQFFRLTDTKINLLSMWMKNILKSDIWDSRFIQ
jgi:hypothetical protein